VYTAEGMTFNDVDYEASTGSSGGLFSCRRVLAASAVVAIACSEPEVTRRFDTLLAALPDGDGVEGTLIDVRIASAGGADYDLCLGANLVATNAPAAACEIEVLQAMNRWALDSDASRLHLHAGLVARSAGGLLIVGESGSGKSTLTAYLACLGWTYHGDEMVAVGPDEACRVRTFPRPLTLKPGSIALLPSLWREPRADVADRRHHVAPGELGPVDRHNDLPVKAVVFLSGQRAGPARLVRLGGTEAVERLLANTLDAERAGVAGIRTLVGLASACHLARLDGDSLAETADLLAELIESPLPPRDPPVRLQSFAAGRPYAWHPAEEKPRSAIGPFSIVRRKVAVEAWVLEDGAVLYDPEWGMLFRFNKQGARVWQALDGMSSLASVAAALAGTEEAVERVCGFARAVRNRRLIDLADIGPRR
jgi:energy-coupling factor transporter ATP-binding protein EcfA2